MHTCSLISHHESKKLLVYNYRNSLAIVVKDYHSPRIERLLVYNYRNPTYDSCKRKTCPDVEGFSVYNYRKSHFH